MKKYFNTIKLIGPIKRIGLNINLLAFNEDIL